MDLGVVLLGATEVSRDDGEGGYGGRLIASGSEPDEAGVRRLVCRLTSGLLI